MPSFGKTSPLHKHKYLYIKKIIDVFKQLQLFKIWLCLCGLRYGDVMAALLCLCKVFLNRQPPSINHKAKSICNRKS
jgi:hypothetical protein